MKLLTPDEILNRFRDTQLSPDETRTQLETVIDSQIAGIDALISRQLNEIIHHPEFRTLEASWRGMHYLVNENRPDRRLKIRVLNAAKRELLKDFEHSLEFEQSSLFKLIYADVFSNPNENPFGLLIGEYEFDNHPQSITLLERLSRVAAHAHAPFISAAAAQLFGIESFSEIGDVQNLTRLFDRSEYAKWWQFRESEDALYVGLCLPHILLREPYDPSSTGSFSFLETVHHETFLWGNAAVAFGGCVAKAYRESGWCGKMRGPASDGAVAGLAGYENGGFDQSVEVLIDSAQEAELSELGFLPLVQSHPDHETAFFSDQSCKQIPHYDTDQANAHVRHSLQLPSTFAMSRFAHYLQIIVRNGSESFADRLYCDRELNRWLERHFHSIGEIGDALRSRFPLSDSRIDIVELPDEPGKLRGIAFLLPAYQLEPLNYSLRTVIELLKPISWQNGEMLVHQQLSLLASQRWTAAKIEINIKALPTNDLTIATRQSWKGLQPLPPARKEISLPRSFTEQEYLKINFGHIPKDMDDKWFVFFENWKLYFHRSWTGFCIYELEFTEGSNQHILKRVLVNREPSQNLETDDEQEISLLSHLINTLLLGSTKLLFNPYQLLLEDDKIRKPYLEFDFEKGLIEGYGGCHYFSAVFEINGNDIKISGIKPRGDADFMRCSEELRSLQGGFLNKLRSATRFELLGKELKFFAERGLLVTFDGTGKGAVN